MQIKYKGGANFEIKSKDLEISLSEKVTINGFNLPGPGEYEKSGVIVSGVADGSNTIYTLIFEEIALCYLGTINHDLSEEDLKQIGNVDILFLPLGENNSADLKVASKLISKIDPRIVIPMLYSDISEFKKAEGATDAEMDMLKIRKIDLPQDETKIVVLTHN